ncbi:LysR family transcriptional regulator [Pseudemcibacter aquimaris]|uniref:LysR family transcriptional regulator n=1 Tax=Pseudemcibacter aquimaris TaxID=2857064 RepID=UPI002013336C|nr:LysR family transcriptional regulator [Pseudemcibacter aquimaris]MCC3860299.1 LysR family transcriptional regulator [Pseudemcibacter aquimaris]WDU57623.1 LysR family transcriptional regulator [Pseudemcibacter aquimaris]
MIENYQLRYFLAVVETGSFTKAAKRVFVTQPTLSAGIKKLEEDLGKKLFNRTSKRVFLTESGTRFVPHAKSILYQLNLAEADIKSTGHSNVLKLGILSTIPINIVSTILSAFEREDGKVVIELFEGTEQEIQNRLEEGQIDIAMTILRPTQNQEKIPLYKEGYSIALPKHHPLAKQETIHPEDFAGEPTIVRSRCEILSETSRFFTDNNVRPRLVYNTTQDERAIAMVAAGVGFTTMPDHYEHDGVRRVKMIGYDFKREIGFVKTSYNLSDESEALLKQFTDFTKTHLPEITYES